MELSEAKRLSLPDILAVLGHEPIKSVKNGQELWYLSPFRKETNASFHTTYRTHLGIWIWNDFADGGGNVIDFAMRYFTTDLRGALERLSGLGSHVGDRPNFDSKASENDFRDKQSRSESTLVLSEVKRLSMDPGHSRALSDYLTVKRRLDPMIAFKYLVEVQFVNSNSAKRYYAAGIMNEHGGYEIRNPWFKSTIGKKGITLFKGKNGTTVAVFEGFIDFLSALTFYQRTDLSKFQHLVEGDTIIMNSLSFHQRTQEVLSNTPYSKIYLFLDNDLPGKKMSFELMAKFKGKIDDCSSVYSSAVDFNDFLLKGE